MKTIYCTIILGDDTLQIPLINKVPVKIKQGYTEIETCVKFAHKYAEDNDLAHDEVMMTYYNNIEDEKPVFDFEIPYSKDFITHNKHMIRWYFNLSEDEKQNINHVYNPNELIDDWYLRNLYNNIHSN